MAREDLTYPAAEQRASRTALLVTTLWAGSLWVIGYVAAPVLFTMLPDNRMMAGVLAGKMFTVTAYLGMACAGYLLLHYGRASGFVALRQTAVRLVIVLLALSLAGQFGLQPLMTDLKAQAFPADVMQSAQAAHFRILHGVSQVLYAIQSLVAAALVLKTRRC